MADMKVEIDVIASMESDRMNCDTSDNVCWDLQTEVIFFISNLIMHLTSHLTNNFQDQSQFVYTDDINLRLKEKCQNYWKMLYVNQNE